MAKNTKLRTYSIGAIIKVWAGCDIQADSYENAVAKAYELDLSDFITVHGDHNDSSFRICQIDRSDLIDTDIDA